MLRLFLVSVIIFVSGSMSGRCDDLPSLRPITNAEAVIAVCYEDWGLHSKGVPAVILAIWPDGHVVWSKDRLRGGAPYFSSQIDREKVSALLARFDEDGLFANKELNRVHFGPDSECVSIFVKFGRKQLKMQSWHELVEAAGEAIADSHGAGGLNGRRRLDVLRTQPADYLFYRFVWTETRGTLNELIPNESTDVSGECVMKQGILSWKESPAKVE